MPRFPRSVLGISAGGAGTLTNVKLKSVAVSDQIKNLFQCATDTDKNDVALAVDHGLPAMLVTARGPRAEYGDNRLETARRFTRRFGFIVQRFFKAFPPEETGVLSSEAGSNTRPFIGGMKYVLMEDEVKAFLRQQLHTALEHAAEVKPVVFGSMGGGTSAAACIYLCDLLGDPQKKRTVTPEADRVLLPSLVFLPPLLQSDLQDNFTLKLRPLANAYAALWEANALAKAGKIDFMYPLHIGNGKGARATTLGEAAEFMADVIARQVVGMSALEARGADGKTVFAGEPGRQFTYA